MRNNARRVLVRRRWASWSIRYGRTGGVVGMVGMCARSADVDITVLYSDDRNSCPFAQVIKYFAMT